MKKLSIHQIRLRHIGNTIASLWSRLRIERAGLTATNKISILIYFQCYHLCMLLCHNTEYDRDSSEPPYTQLKPRMRHSAASTKETE